MAPIWLAGLVWFFTKRAKALGSIGFAAGFVLLLILAMQEKNYCVDSDLPLYFFAGGAVFLERARSQGAWLRDFVAYHHAWHGFIPAVFEAMPKEPLPQYSQMSSVRRR